MNDTIFYPRYHGCGYRKPKHGSSGDEVRPSYRPKLVTSGIGKAAYRGGA